MGRIATLAVLAFVGRTPFFNFKLFHSKYIIMEIKNQTINGGNQSFTDSEISLHRKLSIKEQESILSELFGFSFDDDVLIDDDGREFYGMNINNKFDLSTLNGIFAYAVNRAKNQGFRDCQFNIRHHLGLE